MSSFRSGLLVSAALFSLTAVRAAAQDVPVARQISGAVLPLPDSLRAGAAVLGYRSGKLVQLRAGTNAMICLADDPSTERFQASCYHRSLEPFMVRGRALRAAGLERNAIDSARLAEVKSGTLKMPDGPAALYSVFAASDSLDPAAVDPASLGRLYVIYLPFATEASTGITTQPSRERPWLMHPGLPWAHVMIPK
ncbi:MAG: hypothetical protein AB7I33_13605 [Gemmatimonadales bacterium]